MSRRRSTRQYVERLARELGVDLDISDLGCDAWAPAGSAFAATGNHSVVSTLWDDDGWAVVYGSMAEDLEAGLVPCVSDPCDTCEGV